MSKTHALGVAISDLMPFQCNAGNNAKLDVFSPDGELLDTVYTPRGKRAFSQLLCRYPDDSRVVMVDCAPQHYEVERLQVQTRETDHDTGACPHWTPSGSNDVREMRALVAKVTQSEARMRRLLPSLAAPAPEPSPDPVIEPVAAPAPSPEVSE